MDKTKLQKIVDQVVKGTKLKLVFKKVSHDQIETAMSCFNNLIDRGYFGFPDTESFDRLLTCGAFKRWNRVRDRTWVVFTRDKFNAARFQKYLWRNLDSVELIPA